MDQINQLWVIIAAILVCFMQAGFLCLEAGAVRRKNSINVGAKNIYDLIISLGAFLLIGHLIMFGSSAGGFIGNPFNSSFGPEDKTIILFQAIFAGTAATIVSGSIAERMKFNSYLIIVFILSILVYPIVGHWVWPDALIEGNESWLHSFGFKDFAGCSVVHVVGGAAALAVSLVLGPRHRRFGKNAIHMRSNDHSMSFLGLLLIWIGWFGFNGGSVLAVNGDLIKVIINTIFGGLAGGVGGRIFQFIAKENQHDVWSMISGILGGLVGITAGAIYFTSLQSGIIGLIGGFIAVSGNKILEKFEIDDVVGAIPVHLFAGIWGILALGICGSQVSAWSELNIFEKVSIQAVGISLIMAYAFAIIWAASKLLSSTIGIRVSEEAERIGLNIAEHNASTASYDMINAMRHQVDQNSFKNKLDIEVGTEVGEITEMYNHVVSEMNKYSDEEKALKRQIEINNQQLKFQRDISNTLSKSKTVADGFTKIINPIMLSGKLKGIQLFEYKAIENKAHLIESGWILNGSIINNIELKDQSWRIDNQAIDLVIDTLDQKETNYDNNADLTHHEKWLKKEIEWSIAYPIILTQDLVGIIVVFGGSQSIKRRHGINILIGMSKSLSYLFEREIANDKLKEIAKEAQRANRAKTNFLAMMSHEIRTPMNGVIGMSSLLKETELNNEQHEYTDAIIESSNALLYIINDILDFSKFDSDGFVLDTDDFDLNAVIEGCLSVIGPKTREKGIELLYMINPEVPIYLSGDANRLRQVIINLLGNASKFTLKGEIVLLVNLVDGQTGEEDIKLKFSIKDTGIGIKENKIERLFESFTQADSSTKRKFGGTGLGLSISKKIVTMMKGEIWAESQYGEGSTFYFTASFNEAKDKEKLIESTSSTYSKLNLLFDKRALIIDDNSMNRQILSTQLTNWKMLVTSLTSGKNIKVFLEQEDAFDVIITDYQMPDIYGTEVSKDIHKSCKDDTPPILMLSSVDKHIVMANEDYPEGLIDNILLKPVKQSKLFEHLLKSISKTLKTVAPNVRLADKNDLEAKKYLNQNIAEQHPLKILIVDDNKMNRRLCTIILERAGYTADTAENGLIALEAMAHNDYDVVLMDVEMPVMDGLTAMSKIRKLDSNAKNTYLIALTAAAMSGDKERCFAYGANDYLTKPINRVLFIKALIKAHQTITSQDNQPSSKDTIRHMSTSYSIENKMHENLKEIAGDNQETIQLLKSSFKDELANFKTELDRAYSEKDYSTIKQLSHSLKPNAKLFGDVKLHEQCETLELESQKGSNGEYGLLVKNIQASVISLQSILEKGN